MHLWVCLELGLLYFCSQMPLYLYIYIYIYLYLYLYICIYVYIYVRCAIVGHWCLVRAKRFAALGPRPCTWLYVRVAIKWCGVGTA